MSLAPPSSDSASHDRASRARRRFDDLLFDNPEVCSSCFARIGDYEEHEWQTLGTGNRPTETLERAGDAEMGQDERDHDAYGALTSTFGRTFCGRCGSPGGRASDAHIKSIQRLRGDADRIIRRLHEVGYYPDTIRLYHTVEHLKTQPKYQGQDTEILAVATFLGLEHGREAPADRGRPSPDAWSPTTDTNA